jgi:hypothetical protein
VRVLPLAELPPLALPLAELPLVLVPPLLVPLLLVPLLLVFLPQSSLVVWLPPPARVWPVRLQLALSVGIPARRSCLFVLNEKAPAFVPGLFRWYPLQVLLTS